MTRGRIQIGYEALPGATIMDAAAAVVALRALVDQDIVLVFNSRAIRVFSESTAMEIEDLYYTRAYSGVAASDREGQ